MKISFYKDISTISILISLIIIIWTSININFGKNHWKRVIQADGKGYYAYLPAIFIYKDINFNFFEKIEKNKYYDKNTFYDYRANWNGKTINKYFVGTAVAMLPFFLSAHFLTKLTGGDADGFSTYYPLSINIAAIFYLFIGIILLRKILLINKIKKINIAITLITIIFGTNLFYYTICEPSMSHVYSWAFINFIIYAWIKFIDTFKTKYLALLSLCLGIVALIRPINIIIILSLPFFVENSKQFIKIIKNIISHPLKITTALIPFILIFSLQLLIYKIQTGNFLVYSYGDESFNFLKPKFFNILFSFKKGLFIYTPVLFVSLSGFIYLYKLNKYKFTVLLSFLIILTWVLSSWWNWYYGGSFSSRVYIEYFIFFAILLSIALQNLKTKTKRFVYIFTITLLIIFCQIQTYQYRYFIIHWSDMNFNKYWQVFLKLP
ncbi:MAG TPA: hypothetical protein P5250_00140 [Bacteroidales bacterium]|nr:hypothetical protein [Bacteroidales bacterium]